MQAREAEPQDPMKAFSLLHSQGCQGDAICLFDQSYQRDKRSVLRTA